MKNVLKIYPDKVIVFCFYLLFFLVPLILTPFNYELFEYNKMMVTYALTAVIVGTWMIKMVIAREIKFARSPLDIPLLLFLISQFVSAFFSIDRHVSVWGYYSRFNGGLLSTICYILLYYAFISNFPKTKILNLLSVMLTSGLLVSLYGILERFGIDKNIWVQDVQNRVFSTLGQPNWLAAYLAVLIPIVIGLGMQYFLTLKTPHPNLLLIGEGKRVRSIGLLPYLLIGLLFYLTLLFSKSRSGFLGFWIANSVFWIIFLIKYRIQFTKIFIILNSLFLILTFLFGTPFSQINRFSFSELIKNKQLASPAGRQSTISNQQLAIKPTGDSIIDVGITESGRIRNIVWKGAVDVFLHYPLFGSGVETFAFAYYKYRPAEHNLTSEWDFLYNKAHNEYLNFAATTGVFGLGSYLFIIGSFIWWNIKNHISHPPAGGSSVKIQSRFNRDDLTFGLFTAWLSILITNFFGFSVVIIQLFFYLLPAISFLLSDNLSFVYLFRPKINQRKQFNIQPFDFTQGKQSTINPSTLKKSDFSLLRVNNYQLILSIFFLFAICYLLFAIFRLWYADTIFATGYHYSRAQDYFSAYQSIKEAISLNNNEPFYFDELAFPASVLAVSLKEEKQATFASQLQEEAILASNLAITISPNNVNYWKTRTKIYYVLSQLDEKYLAEAVTSLEIAKALSPTDPKILYNLAVMYDKFGKKSQAKESLIAATTLKPDYRDAYLVLALFYDRDKQREKAKEALNFILTRINPEDAEAKKKLEELK